MDSRLGGKQKTGTLETVSRQQNVRLQNITLSAASN